jgi:spermidine synthase
MVAVICLNGWTIQYTLLFGNHTVSTATIMVSGLLSMALGSFFSGKLADKTKYPLKLFIAFAIVNGIYVLLQPILFRWITEVFLKINSLPDPGPFSIEIFRFTLLFAIVLIPAGLYAGSMPLLIRYFIKHLNNSGRFMSATVFAGSLGVLTGQLLATFMLIPQYGIVKSLLLTVLINMLMVAIAVYFMVRNRSGISRIRIHTSAEQAKRTTLRFKKKKIVLEISAKLTRAMMRVYTFQGFTLASMLFLGYRILANYSLLKPVYYYSTFVTIVMTGLALGSALYKRISEKPANKYLTLATLQIITGFGSALSFTLLNILAEYLYHQALAANTFIILLFNQSLLFASLLFVPAVITGLSLPLAGRLYPKRLQQIGSQFGRLGSRLFLSSLTGIIIVVFVLIPFAGLNYTYLLMVLLILFSGIYLILRDSRLIRGFRLSYAFLAVLVFMIMMGIFNSLTIRLKRPQIENKIVGSAALVNTVVNADSTRTVFINGKYYFGKDYNSLKAQQLSAFIPVLLNQHIQSAMVIGFGTGLTAYWLEKYGIPAIHITDEFPEIIKLSSDVFADDNDDIMTNNHVDITIEDARNYLIRVEQKLDLITSGINQLSQMPAVYSSDFYHLCFNKLSEQGLFCQVIPTTDISGIEFKALLKSIVGVFPGITLWYISPESVLVLAAKKQNKLEPCHLASVFSALNASQSFSAVRIPHLESLLAHIIMDDKQVRSFVQDAPENSDNQPFVKYYYEKAWKHGSNIMPLLIKTPVNYSRLIDLPEGCKVDTTELIRKVKQLNQLLLQQNGFSSGLQKMHVIDFVEMTGSPFPLYL